MDYAHVFLETLREAEVECITQIIIMIPHSSNPKTLMGGPMCTGLPRNPTGGGGGAHKRADEPGNHGNMPGDDDVSG
jgi:hypothetical protein